MATLKRPDGVSLYYEVHGKGPTILLTHGYSATSQMWTGQIEELSRDHQLVIWDMRGHGRSDSPDDPKLYSETATVADMAALLDEVGARTAIVGGLSLGVVVVEAEMRSGSLITARLAAEQGREVFAVPGSPLDPRCAGCNDLIRQGATLCGGVDDILRVLESLPRLEEPGGPEWEPAKMDHAALDRAADALRERLAALLSATPVSRDELGRLVGAPVPAVNAALVELELAGRACLLGGGFVALP